MKVGNLFLSLPLSITIFGLEMLCIQLSSAPRIVNQEKHCLAIVARLSITFLKILGYLTIVKSVNFNIMLGFFLYIQSDWRGGEGVGGGLKCPRPVNPLALSP